MDNEEILELQNDAYTNILEKIATEDDPEKLQQLANAAAQLEKGRNESYKIQNDIIINQQQIQIDLVIQAVIQLLAKISAKIVEI